MTVVAAAALVLTSGCQSTSKAPSVAQQAASVQGSAPAVSVSPSAPATPAVITLEPAGGAPVRADQAVTVSVAGGSLTSVSVTSSAGAKLAGSVEGSQWRLTDPLAPGQTYKLTATAQGGDGVPVTKAATFSTKQADGLVSTTLIPGDDWDVGVGMPVIVVFSRAVKNKAAAEKGLIVEATPATEGAWRWFSATEVHWRPKSYWTPGTAVKVTAAMSNVEVAPGLWGKRTTTAKFTVGRSQILTVDVAAHNMTVNRDGKMIRTIPVTTGKAGYRTRGGIKVIMDRESQVRMDAATLGRDKNDPEYYNLLVNWALRLTYSGEFLHSAPWSVGSQGRANVSHGCTGMSPTNAKWLYDNSKIGDVVVYKNSTRPLEWGNGYTEWNMSFDKYASGA